MRIPAFFFFFLMASLTAVYKWAEHNATEIPAGNPGRIGKPGSAHGLLPVGNLLASPAAERAQVVADLNSEPGEAPAAKRKPRRGKPCVAVS
jgi:hypothetical protein